MNIKNYKKIMAIMTVMSTQVMQAQASELELPEHDSKYCYTMDDYQSNKGSKYYDPNYKDNVRMKFMNYCMSSSTASNIENGIGTGDYYKHKWLFESSNFFKSEENIVQFYSFIDHMFRNHFLENKNVFVIWRQGNISPNTDFISTLEKINVDNLYLRELMLNEANNIWLIVLSNRVNPNWSKTEFYQNAIEPVVSKRMINSLQDSGFNISKYK